MYNVDTPEDLEDGLSLADCYAIPNAVNYNNLLRELQWLQGILDFRVAETKAPKDFEPQPVPPAPVMFEEDSTYGKFVEQHKLSDEERLVLILALVPHLRPQMLDIFLENKGLLHIAKVHRTVNRSTALPTAETALFLISGLDLALRMNSQHIFEAEHLFYQKSVLEIGSVKPSESVYSGILGVTQSFRDLFTQNKPRKPKFSEEFPAQILTTKLEWDDMVLSPFTQQKLQAAIDHLEVFDKMVADWKMEAHARNGCRIMFHGDSGTGKTLAATLIGKYLDKDVYRVDLSTVISKYIGETSKRLNSLFNIAESKGWILFFDEGDAVFAQRKSTGEGNSTSQYANQDVAFLLQRIENYDGIIIVATNLRGNVDAAFTRRFEHVVKFEKPEPALQLQLWNSLIPENVKLPGTLIPELLVKQYSLAPASIVNVVFRVCRMTYKKGSSQIQAEDLLLCLKDEELKHKGRPSFNQ